MLDDSLLTTDEVAQMVRVSAKTIRRWQAAGRIPFVRIGVVIRYRKCDIDRWIEEKLVVGS